MNPTAVEGLLPRNARRLLIFLRDAWQARPPGAEWITPGYTEMQARHIRRASIERDLVLLSELGMLAIRSVPSPRGHPRNAYRLLTSEVRSTKPA